MSEPCGNRGPISGECMMGCGGFGSCRQGHEDHIPPRDDLVNPLTGKMYRRALPTPEKDKDDGR